MAAINAVKIFSGSASNYLAKDIAKFYGKDFNCVNRCHVFLRGLIFLIKGKINQFCPNFKLFYGSTDDI